MFSLRFICGIMAGIVMMLIAGEVIGVDYAPLYRESARQVREVVHYLQSYENGTRDKPKSEAQSRSLGLSLSSVQLPMVRARRVTALTWSSFCEFVERREA